MQPVLRGGRIRASPAEDGGQLSDSFDDTRLPTFVAHASLTVDCKSSASLEVSIMSQLMDVDLLTYRSRFAIRSRVYRLCGIRKLPCLILLPVSAGNPIRNSF